MAKLFAGIDTERNTQVTRLGHRELSSFLQSDNLRVTVDAIPGSFKISIGSGRYQNFLGKNGTLAIIKDGKILIPPDLMEHIILTS